MEIILSNCPQQLKVEPKAEETVRAAIVQVAALYDVGDAEISVTLTDNAHIKEMNASYRGKDEATDVLSFALNEVEGEEEEPEVIGGPQVNVLGDLVISVERAAEQAEEYGHSMEREMAYLTVHGMLHLLGYDHMEEEERAEMRREEEYVLEHMGITREQE